MWLLSGAFFPPEGAATWLGWIMRINPLTWCVQSVRNPMLGGDWRLALIAAASFAFVMIVIATVVVSRRSRTSL
jgi:ABC-type polysaccharide/polyol phosphate export permease